MFPASSHPSARTAFAIETTHLQEVAVHGYEEQGDYLILFTGHGPEVCDFSPEGRAEAKRRYQQMSLDCPKEKRG